MGDSAAWAAIKERCKDETVDERMSGPSPGFDPGRPRLGRRTVTGPQPAYVNASGQVLDPQGHILFQGPADQLVYYDQAC